MVGVFLGELFFWEFVVGGLEYLFYVFFEIGGLWYYGSWFG